MLRNIRGVTLIEMAIVIVIMVVIYTIALPSSLKSFSLRAEGEVRKIISDFAMVQEMAVTRRRAYCMRFNSTHYQVFNATTCGNPSKVIKTEPLLSLITSPSSSFNITFYPLRDVNDYMVSTTFSSFNYVTITLKHVQSSNSIRIYRQTGYVRYMD